VKLPEAERAIIDPRKLRDYVLSPIHPVGRFKAKFFATLGFTPDNWKRLDSELRRLIREEAAELDEETPFGQKYLVRGGVTGPTGRMAIVISAWIILRGERFPRLVNVLPGSRR
jgi:hypothetical protein